MTTPPTDAPSAAPPVQSIHSALFGRGMLYVVVWSSQLVISTLISPVLAYLLGPGDFGSLASGLAIFQVVSVVAVLGLDQALVLQRAEDGHSRSARGLIAVGTVLAVVICTAAAASSPLWREFLGFRGDGTLVLAAVVWAAPAAVVQMCLALLLAEDRLRPFVIVSIVSGAGGQVAGIVAILVFAIDPVVYLGGCIVAQLAATVIAAVAIRPRLGGLRETRIARRAVRLGIPLAVGGLAYFVLNAGDRLVIQAIAGADEVGRYQVAYVVGSVMILLLTFVSASWTPRFAAIRNAVERWTVACRSRDDLYRILIPAILGVTLASPVLLRLVAPSSFRPESLRVVVFVVALAALPQVSSVVTGRLLLVQRRGVVLGGITGIVALLNIGLNILLVPVWGIAGAAAATFVAYALMSFLQLRSLPREPRWLRPPARLIVGAGLAISVAGTSLFLPQTTVWNAALLVAALACLPWFLRQLRKAREATDAGGEG